MSKLSKAFISTSSLYSTPVGYGENYQDVVDCYYEPITYTSEMEKISRKLEVFLGLKKGWDGYSAVVPKEKTIENVLLVVQNLKDKYLKLLDEEDIVPSPYGTISLYFEDVNNNELSIEFGREFIGISGEINGEEIIIDNIPVYDFNIAIENIDRLSVPN